ncbi:mitochondrial 37S ribosomal protein bS16m [Ascoidea rubescens DSM 1968]|uniref:Ribosomal protein S16 n=1 Tax=Ascoidea rubescens DSM 1968 TaxID=1344418 RepID=A0A1D2V9Z3_9ASCO|nr:ribosomal protein S16 [Ascoidea rubescens DSM 1968]ODV58458.1 ribosomal protein S16 [Ascoidea rubescens DSM 1968]
MAPCIRIRLARFGRRNSPLYNIVVAKSRSRRDGKPIEVLGTYNPIPRPINPSSLIPPKEDLPVKLVKDIELDFEKSKYWIGVGAQPSKTVIRLFQKAGILGEEWSSFDKNKKILNSKQVVPPRNVIE